MKRIIFRADAGRDIGYGHFIRSLALASYLSDRFKCEFCTFNQDLLHPTEYQIEEIKKVCVYHPISAADLEEFNDKFNNIISKEDIVVLDNYYFTEEYQKLIRAKGCKLVCIDDLHNRHFVSDGLITVCPLSSCSFSKEPYTQFLGGLKYSFLRSPFLSVNRKGDTPDKPSTIVIAIGGADPFRLTEKIIDIIRECPSELTLHVIAGDMVQLEPSKKDNIIIHRRLTAEEIVGIFSECDLGVFSASTVCVEAMACGLRSAVGWYVDNQKELYEYGVENRLFLPLGNFFDSREKISSRLFDAFENFHTYQSPGISFKDGRKEIETLFSNL